MNKDILAKLLATENITVVQENAKTASFNVRDRVLTLPLWENLDGDNYDHFIGHEVGHALYTPEDGWHDAVCDRGRAYKSFLNVIEDARIEKLIQRKYPGLRRNFVNSYKKLLADGFFGADLEEINTFDLIDRINSYFKLGQSAGVRIERDEMSWIKEIDACETWEQVVDITDRLFAQEKAKKEEEQQLQEEMMEEMGEDEGETEEVETDGFSESDWEMGDDEGEEEETDQDVPSESDFTDGEGEEESEEEVDSTDPISKTEESLHSNIRKEFNEVGDTQVSNFKINTNDVRPLIIGYKNVLQFSNGMTGLQNSGQVLFKKFQGENKNVVNYMVKEFEMKKKASEYARTSLAKTGVLDPVKMNNYKFSDDIFRKVSVTPQGKSHGLVMYVDWSGSMKSHVYPTIQQLLNLVMFCRQVNIPYRVYLFSDRFGNQDNTGVNEVPVNTLVYRQGFRLLELFNNKMSRSDFSKMAGNLLAVGQFFNQDTNYWIPREFNLGGTPLDDTIMASVQIYKEFKASNRLDIVNTVFLTDGDSHDIEVAAPSRYREGCANICPVYYFSGKDKICKFIDPVTKRQYRLKGYNASTKALLQLFRDRTESNAIGYRIMPLNKRIIFSELRHLGAPAVEQIHNDLKKDRFTTIPNQGYSKFFALAGGKSLETANTSIQVESDATVAKIRSAFKKANSNRKSTRVLLSQFIEMVA